MFLEKIQAISKINEFGQKRKPFLFVIDFKSDRSIVASPQEAAAKGIYFSVPGFSNYYFTPDIVYPFSFELKPVAFEIYCKSFNQVMWHLKRGDTYLLNLTFPTKIQTNLSLESLFKIGQAPYKLIVQNLFVVFSPEIFTIIKDGNIFSYPMKGTIDAAVNDAEQRILEDRKECYEHNTIVDLIRNDLAMVAHLVKVKRFRYIDRIKTNRKELLQVSSEICGKLPDDYPSRLGEIIFTLLPAGSVTGAPKEKTVQIIRQAETYERGFYTGVFGYYDGRSLTSAVMIRFIENISGDLIFKSGGGITALSDPEMEYRELIDKVYVPVI